MNRKQAEPILPEEEHMWKTGVLGAHTPQSLLDTMVCMCGLYFALCSGQEHRNIQLSWWNPLGVLPYIWSTLKMCRKIVQVGLSIETSSQKRWSTMPTTKGSERCFVRLFKAYCVHRPPKVEHNSSYLTPLQNPKSIVWSRSHLLTTIPLPIQLSGCVHVLM